MSFTKGFEKTALDKEAFLGAAVGRVAGTVSKATKGLTEGVKNFATKQRVARVDAFRSAASGKTNPTSGKALSRLDQMKDYKQNKGKSIFAKHPIATAVGGYMAASHLMKSDQPPQPPPQVVQY